MATIITPILFIAAILYIAYPFLSESAGREEAEESDGSQALLDEKEELLASLKDIEMDYRMGKLSLQDYNNLRADFERKAADVLRRLEQEESASQRLEN